MIIGIDASRGLRARRTGTERYSLEIIRHLLNLPEAAQHTFRLYMDRQPTPDETFWDERMADVRVLPARRLWTHTALAGEVMRHRPDVLFVPSHVIPFAPPRLLPPGVVTLHDVGYRHFPAAHTTGQRLYLELSTRWSSWAARRVIAPSQATADDLARFYGTPAAKLRVIYEACSWELLNAKTQRRKDAEGEGFNAEARRCRGAEGEQHNAKVQRGKDAKGEQLNAERRPEPVEGAQGRRDAEKTSTLPPRSPRLRGENSPYALYVGTLQPRKNLGRLIDAYARLVAREDVQWELVIAGGLGWLGEPFQEQAAALGLADRIHFPGYVADEALPGLFTGALFFAFPSLYEGFGLPVLEAQQMGVAVMTSNNSSLPEVAGDAALLVDPNDVEAIADAMLRLSRDETLRQTLIAKGYENVKRFSWEKAARETLAVLVEAAGER